MSINEFLERTKTFMKLKDPQEYHNYYEPAYMVANSVDKDQFCATLKDENVRKMVVDFVKHISALKKQIKAKEDELAQFNHDYGMTMRARKDIEEKLVNALRLISATCDRAL